MGATLMVFRRPHAQRPKRRKPKITRVSVVVRGRYPNHVWVIDFQFDETADGQPMKILDVTDKFTREALATDASQQQERWLFLTRLANNVAHHSFCVWTTD